MAITITDSRPLGPKVFVASATADLQVSGSYAASTVIKLGAQPGDIIVDADGEVSFILVGDKTLQQIGAWSSDLGEGEGEGEGE